MFASGQWSGLTFNETKLFCFKENNFGIFVSNCLDRRLFRGKSINSEATVHVLVKKGRAKDSSAFQMLIK